MERNRRYFSCDFETTVYEGQERTDVWAGAVVELFTEEVRIFGSIKEVFNYFKSLRCNIIAYFHNLKFDGSFWLDYLMKELKYKQALIKRSEKPYDVEWKQEKEMRSKEFKYIISERGQWYSFIIKQGKFYIEIRDSLKLLPFSVKRIGESFKTKHKKLDMEYKGFRYPGCKISEEEKEYIRNDVLVIKEALEIMYEQGHKKMTIGSCCLSEYRRIIKENTAFDYNELFPDLTKIESIEPGVSADDWIRKSYKGGWCYNVKDKVGKILHNGITMDVNSLYPSVMHSVSGNRYPVGEPHFWAGDYVPEAALKSDRYYFIRIKTRFQIKPGYLPFIQIKNSFAYEGNESLETSDWYESELDKYFSTDENGNKIRVELTLTMTDYELIKEHYYLDEPEIMGGCWFFTEDHLFDDYINTYMEIKKSSTGAVRELAKLFLNNLYGKLAANDSSSFKVAYLKDEENIGFYSVEEHNKKAGFIACGSAVTSYARNFTIRAAQKNYHGPGKGGFCYADTDSLHCDMQPEELVGIEIDSKDLLKWKLESRWDEAIFTRQKTYIEHITHEGEELEEPYYNVKCAGMPEACKKYFIEELMKDGGSVESILDFKVGLKVPGKLMPKRIPGGVLLTEGYYEMR